MANIKLILILIKFDSNLNKCLLFFDTEKIEILINQKISPHISKISKKKKLEKKMVTKIVHQ